MNYEYEADGIDFYDFDALEKLQEKLARAEYKLMKKVLNGDEKAKESLRKHKLKVLKIKERAQEVGYYWY